MPVPENESTTLHPGAPTIAVRPQADRPLGHLSPDQAIASSPLIKENGSSPLRFLNDKSRISQASSFRLSKDMANLRWDGAELREDELREEDEDADYGGHVTTEDSDSDTDADMQGRSKEEIEAVNYSTLSKRADFILAHAKKKLNLLEGNLGKARHSLTTSPHATSEFRSASSQSNYATPSLADVSDDPEGAVRISPRINFGTPRHLRNGPPRQTGSGHSRMFSDTSVPPPGGIAVKGSRSLELMQGGDIHEQLSTANSSNGVALDTVAEDEEADKSSTIHSLRELYGAASPPPKSTQELRDQAEELRNRIAFLQKRSRDDAVRGQYLANNPSAGRNELAFISQVEALERSLEDQEEVIEQLENAERSKATIQEDPREEWQQVLESNQVREEESSFSDDDYYDEYDELPDNLPDVLGDEDVDETKDMAAAHEDREDAFDYEHFILHSTMGRGIARSSSTGRSESSEPSLSGDSDGSVATERGVGPDADGEVESRTASGKEQRRPWDEFQQPNDSMASLTTTQSFETANEDADSEISDASDQPPEDLLHTGLRNPWPMPPQRTSADGQRTMFRDSDIPTPTAGAFPHLSPEMEDRGVQHSGITRGSTSIFEALMIPEDMSEPCRPLDRSDADLVRACAASLRAVCLEAIHPSTGPRDIKAIRERLEVAKKVLDGEL